MTKSTAACANMMRSTPRPPTNAQPQQDIPPARLTRAGARRRKICHPVSYKEHQPSAYNRISGQPIVAAGQKQYCDTVRWQDHCPLARNWYRRQASHPAGGVIGISAGRANQDGGSLVPPPAEVALAAWPTSPDYAQRVGSPLSSPKVFECHLPDAHATGDGTQTLRGPAAAGAQ